MPLLNYGLVLLESILCICVYMYFDSHLLRIREARRRIAPCTVEDSDVETLLTALTFQTAARVGLGGGQEPISNRLYQPVSAQLAQR